MASTESIEGEPISLQFTWTPQEFDLLCKEHSAWGPKSVFRRICWVLLIIALLLYGTLVCLQKQITIETILLGACLLLIGGASTLFTPWFQARHLKRFRTSLLGKEIHWEISGSELVNTLSDGTGGKMHWDSITGAHKGQNGFLLYITPSQFLWLPYHAFSSGEEIDRLEKTISISVKDFHKIAARRNRIILGFLIAPLVAPVPSFFFFLKYYDLPFLLYETIILFIPVAFAVTFILGIPLFLVLRRTKLYSLTSTLVCGALLGFTPILIITPKAIVSLAAGENILYLFALAMNGLIGAFVFCLIVGVKNMPKKET